MISFCGILFFVPYIATSSLQNHSISIGFCLILFICQAETDANIGINPEPFAFYLNKLLLSNDILYETSFKLLQHGAGISYIQLKYYFGITSEAFRLHLRGT